MNKMDAFNHAAHAGRGGIGLSHLFGPIFHNGRIMTAIMAGLLIYLVIQWLFRSAGLYHLAKKRDIAHAWFAWVPFLSDYVLGELINGKVIFGESLVTNDAEFYLPLVSLISATISLFGFRSWIGQVLIVVFAVYKLGALWRLFKMYKPESRVAYTILSLIFRPGFFIFAIRNEKPFDELEVENNYNKPYVQDLAFEGFNTPVIENDNFEELKKHTDDGEDVINEHNNILINKKENLHNQHADIMNNENMENTTFPYIANIDYKTNDDKLQGVFNC